mmetsp:Transcript_11665/g.22653  ORF Transcript_11665/g.22653 Transcript_11665/m.22653 type:complete len:88 (-) Transcript_11665:119-382(-)
MRMKVVEFVRSPGGQRRDRNQVSAAEFAAAASGGATFGEEGLKGVQAGDADDDSGFFVGRAALEADGGAADGRRYGRDEAGFCGCQV